MNELQLKVTRFPKATISLLFQPKTLEEWEGAKGSRVGHMIFILD